MGADSAESAGVGFLRAGWPAFPCSPTRRPQRAPRIVQADIISRQTGYSIEKFLTLIRLDLASLQSVDDFVSVFKQTGMRILALCCNAGVQDMSGSKALTNDGFEPTFAVNHLAHYYLTKQLLPFMHPERGRIIFVASDVHDPATKTGMPDPGLRWPADITELAKQRDNFQLKAPVGTPGQKGYKPAVFETNFQAGSRRYTESKLCNVLCTLALSRKLANGDLNWPGATNCKHVSVMAFNPGPMVGTGLVRTWPNWLQNTLFALRMLGVVKVLELTGILRNPRTSGRHLASLLTGDDFRQHTSCNGTYVDGCKLKQPSVLAQSVEQQEALMEASEKLLKSTGRKTFR